MHLEGMQQYTMLSHIKIQHHLEIKYLVSKLVTISLDVFIKCVEMHPREIQQNITLEAFPQSPALSKRFPTEMQRKTVRQIPNTLVLQQQYAAISCKIL